jgi:hypothetical protein
MFPKPSRLFFMIALAAIAVLLVAFYAVREIRGPFLPQAVDENFFTAVIVALLGLFLWNRKIWSDEKKAAAIKAEEEKAAEGGASSEGGDAGKGGDVAG